MTDTERAISFFENALENCVMVARKPFETALAALRRKTEDGKAFPCKVGDMVYAVYSDEDGSIVEELIITEVSTHRIWVKGKCFVYSEIGKTVFLTRQAAEAALPDKSKDYPCRGHDCYDRGNFHASCSACPLYGTQEAALGGGAV